MFCTELHVVQEQLRQDEPTGTARGITEVGADDDVGLSQGTLDAMHEQVAEVFGDSAVADTEGAQGATDDAGEPVAYSTLGGCGADTIDKTTQKLKYPRGAQAVRPTCRQMLL